MCISKNLRVLYADDNKDSCEMVTIMLEFAEIEVMTATKIEEAWKIANSENFDLYLLDSQFPDGDGLELCRKLREYSPEMPILIYSAKAFKADIQNGLSAGADIYLTKPYLDDLAEIIQNSIKNKKIQLDKIYSYALDKTNLSHLTPIDEPSETHSYLN